MRIRDLLMKEFSSGNTQEICLYIDDNRIRFQELMQCYLDPDQELARRAAWVLGKQLESYPHLADGHLPDLIAVLTQGGLHDGVVRAAARSLQYISLDPDYQGAIWDGCAELLMGAKTPIAVKVFAMSALHRIVKEVPELRDELIFMIEEQFPFGSTGFRNRAGKILRDLKRI